MIKLFLATASAFLIFFKVNAQTCDISIEILPEKYMYGSAAESNESRVVDDIMVDFGDEVMKIIVPLKGKNYKIEVLNDNCQAYCKKAKRVRQLHSGDEKLVINLINQRKEDIISQIEECGI